MARLRLDPSSASGYSTEPEKPSYKPYFAGGPGKVSLVDSVAGKHGAVRLELADMDDVTIASAPTDDQVIAYDSATSQFIPQSIAAVSGAGDVDGPASSTDNAIARFDGATGKLLENSTATLNDAGGIATTIADGGNTAALTIVQNDVTNNKIGIDLTNAGTNSGLLFTQDGIIAGLASAFRLNSTAAQTQTATGALLDVVLNNTSATGTASRIFHSGAGRALLIDHNAAGGTVFIDKDVTNANLASAISLQIDHTSVVNDGGTYTKTTPAVLIQSTVTETSGTITDSAIVLDINQTHADATGNVLDIDNDGTGSGINIAVDGTLASGKAGVRVDWNSDNSTAASSAIHIQSNFAHTSSTDGRALLRMINDNASSLAQGIFLQQDGDNEAIFIDNNNASRSIVVDHDASTASVVTGVFIDVDNASTGGAIGLDISNVTATSGTVIGQRIALPSGGTTNYALQLSDTTGVAAGGITFGTDVQLYRSAANTLTTDDGVNISIANSLNKAGLTITQADTTNNPRSINVVHGGTGRAMNIANSGNSTAIGVESSATSATGLLFQTNSLQNGTAVRVEADALTTGFGLIVTSNSSSLTTTDGMVFFKVDHASATSRALKIQQDGTGQGILIDQNGNGVGLDIDHDGNSASKIWGAAITVDNAGAGGVGGIDFSGMTTDEAIFKGTADAITATGTISHQIPIDIGGTIFYLVAYTHGS